MIRYLAGFFDGEGCIHIATVKSRCSLRAQVGNNRVDVLNIFKDIFGGTIHAPKGYNFSEWRITGTGVEGFLEAMLPYLILKKEEAELGLEYRSKFKELNMEQREKYRIRMRNLKRRK